MNRKLETCIEKYVMDDSNNVMLIRWWIKNIFLK